MIPSDEDLRKKARAFHQRADESLRYQGITVESSDIENAAKVRVFLPSLRTVKTVKSPIQIPGIPVFVEMRAGRLQVVDYDYETGVQMYGAAFATRLLPTGQDETKSWSIPGNGFKPGRVEPSDRDGLYVHVSAFFYEGGYWDDGLRLDPLLNNPTLNDFSLANDVPTDPLQALWSLVYFDPADAAMHHVAGTPITGNQFNLNEADIADIPLPYGVYPLGAVALATGQTVIDDATRIVTARIFLDANGIVVPGWLVKTPTTIPSGASMVQAGSVAIRGNGSLTIDGGLYIV